MKLGYIDYLNTYPLYYHMMEKERIPGVHIIPGYPSYLNSRMSNAELDMSPISSATYAKIQDEVLLLPDFCIGSIGYVRSVILISKLPIEELDGRKVGLTSASQTSIVMLQCLLRAFYGIEPDYTVKNPSPTLKDLDAALIIGNEAMTNTNEVIPYTYDLGDLWHRKTGFPVVFAVFTVRKSSLRKHGAQMKSVVKSYHRSLSCLQTEEDTLIQKAQDLYPDVSYDISHYYRLLEYRLSEELKEALTFYFSLAGDLGILDRVSSLNFLSDELDLHS